MGEVTREYAIGASRWVQSSDSSTGADLVSHTPAGTGASAIDHRSDVRCQAPPVNPHGRTETQGHTGRHLAFVWV